MESPHNSKKQTCVCVYVCGAYCMKHGSVNKVINSARHIKTSEFVVFLPHECKTYKKCKAEIITFEIINIIIV